ncbi:hypothetical protein AGR7C_Cc160138 [Agrobacterium deltaense Zutra 3/1]|uniref:Uncharacterized protein n=1 Tax=Agrobacterium deltaense Zutra 3/1 TaxID=1183427 RepID=A0A1S7PLU9_9HYPH|nr:hypothetical protein [Agrobacterium deltaense]CUX23195.1 hypothetical protein AGR7C_Cc160138 [Agrobacterium deltaense Zutra 3/1]
MTEKKVLRPYAAAEVSAILNTRSEPRAATHDFSRRGVTASAVFEQRRANIAQGKSADRQQGPKPSVTTAAFSQSVFAARKAATGAAKPALVPAHSQGQPAPATGLGSLDAAIEQALKVPSGHETD